MFVRVFLTPFFWTFPFKWLKTEQIKILVSIPWEKKSLDKSCERSEYWQRKMGFLFDKKYENISIIIEKYGSRVYRGGSDDGNSNKCKIQS